MAGMDGSGGSQFSGSVGSSGTRAGGGSPGAGGIGAGGTPGGSVGEGLGGFSDPVVATFIWRYGGANVHLCGSFTNWSDTLPMTRSPHDANHFLVMCQLQPGYHQFKFIVDGEWRYDEQLPFMRDPDGNINNLIYIQKQGIAPPGAGSSGSLPGAEQHGGLPGAEEGGAEAAVGPPDDLMLSVATPEMDMAMADVMGRDRGEQTTTSAIVGSCARLVAFLEGHTAYGSIPESSRVVAFDSLLPVRAAFHALFDQRVHGAALWDARAGYFGMMTCTDFINILQAAMHDGKLASHKSQTAGGGSGVFGNIDHHRILDARIEMAADGTSSEPGDGITGGGLRKLVSVSPTESLRSCVEKILSHRLHRLPILDNDIGDHTGQMLSVCTFTRLLRFTVSNLREHLPLFNIKLGQLTAAALGIAAQSKEAVDLANMPVLGTYGARVLTVQPDASVVAALRLMVQHGISSVPIVDERGILLDIYSRRDVLYMARGLAYVNLAEMNVQQAVSLRRASLEDVHAVSSRGSGVFATGGGAASHLPPMQASTKHALAARYGDPVTITRNDTMKTVIERLATGAHRLVCVDDVGLVEGIVSMHDLFKFIVLPPRAL